MFAAFENAKLPMSSLPTETGSGNCSGNSLPTLVILSGINICTRDLAPPTPEFGAELWKQILDTDVGPEFLGRIF